MFHLSRIKKVGENVNFFPHCAKSWRSIDQQLPPPPPPTDAGAPNKTGKVSNAWFLVPLVFSVVGGIVGYIMVRKRDKNKANLILGIGCIVFIIEVLLL